MRSMHLMIPALLLVMILALPASAQVTIGTGTSEAGNLYTTGNIYVASTPAGASAVLDGGIDQLVTPGTFLGVPPGQHNVRVTIPGYQAASTDVVVSVGMTANVLVTLNQVVTPGGLSVSSTPPGSGLYIDDLYQGKTSQVVGNLQPGPHKVTVAEPGYITVSQTVTVVAGDVIPVSVTLAPENNPPTGDLQVSSDPSGAVVYLNGDYKGFTPPNDQLDILDLSPGSYTVVIRKLGYQDDTTQITVGAGQIVRVSATLQPETQLPAAASADIVSTPSGAEVYVDNQFVGITPLMFQNITPGSYTIELRLAGYNSFTATGQVQSGESVHIVAALSPVATPVPTTQTPSNPFLVLMAIGIVCLAGYLVIRR
jgi:hypothetical protein